MEHFGLQAFRQEIVTLLTTWRLEAYLAERIGEGLAATTARHSRLAVLRLSLLNEALLDDLCILNEKARVEVEILLFQVLDGLRMHIDLMRSLRLFQWPGEDCVFA